MSIASLLTSVLEDPIFSARAKSFFEMVRPDCMVSDMLPEMFMAVDVMKDESRCGGIEVHLR